jgi:DNA-directed RNA polymerase specialized sigma24 family protein
MTAAFATAPGFPTFAPLFTVWQDSEWRQIVDGIQTADAGAAQRLYWAYTDVIRNVLRRYSGCDDVEDSVLTVFLSGLRRVRFCDVRTRQDFEQALEMIARDEALSIRHRRASMTHFPEIALHLKSEILNSVFMQLDGVEREIVLRACLLGERDADIAADLQISESDVNRAHAKARTLYHNSHPCRQSPAQRI